MSHHCDPGPGLLDAIRATGGASGAGLKSAGEAPPPPPAGDPVSGLLDAIRKAGGKEGAGLKSIKERKAEERKRRGEEEAAPPPSGGGGDLMGDLMSKLTMRRKGISGTKAGGGKDPEEQGGGDARVSWACTEVWWPVAGLGPWCPLAVHEPPPWLPLQCSFTTVDITANMVWIPTYPAGAGTGYSGLWGEAWSEPRGPYFIFRPQTVVFLKFWPQKAYFHFSRLNVRIS